LTFAVSDTDVSQILLAISQLLAMMKHAKTCQAGSLLAVCRGRGYTASVSLAAASLLSITG
jgi:hypothetical protein